MDSAVALPDLLLAMPTPAAVAEKAALIVCGRARDVEEARELLAMLGLSERVRL